MAKNDVKNRVILIAVDAYGRPIEQLTISYEDFYEGGIPVIDSNAYRAEKGVRSLRGEVYNSQGTVQQRFENQYSEDGSYTTGRTTHEDGTVIEDWSTGKKT